jgi:hypothetical protein
MFSAPECFLLRFMNLPGKQSSAGAVFNLGEEPTTFQLGFVIPIGTRNRHDSRNWRNPGQHVTSAFRGFPLFPTLDKHQATSIKESPRQGPSRLLPNDGQEPTTGLPAAESSPDRSALAVTRGANIIRSDSHGAQACTSLGATISKLRLQPRIPRKPNRSLYSPSVLAFLFLLVSLSSPGSSNLSCYPSAHSFFLCRMALPS